MPDTALPSGAYAAACAAGPGSQDPLLAGLVAAAPLIVEDWLRTHEHEWTQCPECKQPGQPCPCSGVPCCELERRETAAETQGAAEERERAVAELERLRGIIRSLTAERDELVSEMAVLKASREGQP